MITKTDVGLCLQCDACSNYIVNREWKSFKEVSDAGKLEGWICRKIEDDWHNFCCEECYQQKKSEIELQIGKIEVKPIEKAPDWKVKTFETELNYIENEALRTLAQRLINQLPDYFFEVAASSTGKYHPEYCLGKGGLVRHTKAAVRMAIELLRIDMYKTLLPAKDYIIIALILHDGLKHGEVKEDGSYSNWSVFTHPKVAADFVRNSNKASQEVLEYIAKLVECHMGQWTQNYTSGLEQLQYPTLPEQWFVHQCDYLASRKCIEIDVEEPVQ